MYCLFNAQAWSGWIDWVRSGPGASCVMDTLSIICAVGFSGFPPAALNLIKV